MSYNDDMSNEQAPRVKCLLPQGWRVFKFVGGREETSKAGNNMFIMTIQDIETDYKEEIYVVRTPGKRWTLKCILDSFGIERKSDGSYNYDLPDLLEKQLVGLVIQEPNEYINRAGETVKTIQHKIVDFKKFDPTNVDGKPAGNPDGIDDPADIKW